MQLFAQDFGPTGNFNAKVDWFYLDYRFADWLGVRAGRVKIPFGLYNEIQDVDSARDVRAAPAVGLPRSRTAITSSPRPAARVYGYMKVGAGRGARLPRLRRDDPRSTRRPPPGSPYQVESLNVPYLVGGRLLWETPIEGLRLGGSVQTLRIDTQLLRQTTPVTRPDPRRRSPSARSSTRRTICSLAAEYSRWYVSANSSNAAAFPSVAR